MAKLQQYKGQFTISIPSEYVEQAQWQKGDTITISFNERGNVELAKVRR